MPPAVFNIPHPQPRKMQGWQHGQQTGQRTAPFNQATCHAQAPMVKRITGRRWCNKPWRGPLQPPRSCQACFFSKNNSFCNGYVLIKFLVRLVPKNTSDEGPPTRGVFAGLSTRGFKKASLSKHLCRSIFVEASLSKHFCRSIFVEAFFVEAFLSKQYAYVVFVKRAPWGLAHER